MIGVAQIRRLPGSPTLWQMQVELWCASDHLDRSMVRALDAIDDIDGWADSPIVNYARS